jgi:serine/threonine-protein phosphatase 2B catalytic subunit
MTEQFTFREEVVDKYDEETYELFMDLFDNMPIAGLVADKYFAMHGGIGPSLKKIEDIDVEIDRFQEVPTKGLFCDLMWADPVDERDSDMVLEFAPNNDRDCSHYFGKIASKKLIEENSLVSILRGHQVMLEGYKMHRWVPPSKDGKSSRSTMSQFSSASAALEFPTVVTIFSAPNYCGTYDNKGAYFLLDHGMVRMKTFNETLAPYRLPPGYNAFNWSVPFMADNVLKLLNHIV